MAEFAVGVLALVALAAVFTLAKVTLDLSGKFVALTNPIAHKQILDADTARVAARARPSTEAPLPPDVAEKLDAFRRQDWSPAGAADLTAITDPNRNPV